MEKLCKQIIPNHFFFCFSKAAALSCGLPRPHQLGDWDEGSDKCWWTCQWRGWSRSPSR